MREWDEIAISIWKSWDAEKKSMARIASFDILRNMVRADIDSPEDTGVQMIDNIVSSINAIRKRS